MPLIMSEVSGIISVDHGFGEICRRQSDLVNGIWNPESIVESHEES